MQSVEHLVEKHQLAQESKDSLAERLSFERYQQDFLFNEKSLTEKALLDVGTGQGNFIHYLRKTFGNKNAYGVDFDNSILSSNEPYLSCADIKNLPYEDRLFDITLSRNVLHGIFLSSSPEEIRKALSELIRITKNGGCIMYAIKSPEAIKKGILDIEDADLQKSLLERLARGVETEAIFLDELQKLGNIVSVTFRDSRKIVKIQKPTVQ